MNLNSYEAKVVGEKLYMYLAKRHNLTTQKWTLGRTKEFNKEVKRIVKERVGK